MTHVPRRNDLSRNTHAERAIYRAMLAVEAAGADPALTEVSDLLEQARTTLADYVDAQQQPSAATA